MALTTNFGWDKPTVGGDSGAWGTKLNTLADDVDADLKTVKDTADAALPKTGGVMTGRVDVKTSTIARQDKGSISGAQSLDLAVAQYFSLQVGGALTLSIVNAASGTVAQGIVLRIVNGGAFAITWPASVKWPNGSAPAFTVAGTDVVVLLTDDNGTTWRAVIAMKDVH